MKTTSKEIILRVFTLLMLLNSFGCSDVSVNPLVNEKTHRLMDDIKVKAHKSFSSTIAITSQKSLRLVGLNGSINIESIAGTNQVTVSGKKIVSANTYHEANSHLKDIAIELDELTDELLIKTLQPDYSAGRSYSVDYTIKIPSNLSLTVKSVNGKIMGKVTVPLNGNVNMSLQNGNVEVEIPKNTSADFSASLNNGIISVKNLTITKRVATSKSVQGILRDGQGMISLNTTNGIINVIGF